MKYTSKTEATNHLSKNPDAAKKQIEMIDFTYKIGSMVSQNDLDNIELDVHQDATKKAMSY